MSAVRRAIFVVRYEWLDVRIGGQYASMKGLWPTLLVTAAVVFGCFFVIGRRGSEVTSRHEPSSALGALPRAAIPGELRGGSPIPGSLPSRAVAQVPRSSSATAQTAAVGGRSSAAIQAQSPVESASTALASLPAPAAAVQTVPAEAPVRATKSPDHSSASVQPSSSRGGSHSSSSGGSFDRSE